MSSRFTSSYFHPANFLGAYFLGANFRGAYFRGTYLLGAMIFSVSAFFAQPQARAAELLMFERQGCVYCERWMRDIAPAYMSSKEATRAPLRRIDINKGRPKAVSLSAPVRYTPTFVLVDQGKEIGRITGYFDNAVFWGLLERMIQDLR